MGNSPPTPVEPPSELHVFKELDGVPMEYNIPEIPEKRKSTDQFFFFLFVVITIALVPLVIYTLLNSDIKRVTNGYDNCGNVCGEKNQVIDGINCTGMDYRKQKILRYESDSALLDLDNLDLEPNECVEDCDELLYFRTMNRCFKMADPSDGNKVNSELTLVMDQQIIDDLRSSVGYVVGMVFISVGICLVFLILFKYMIGIVVKMIIFACLLFVNGFTLLTLISPDAETGPKVLLLVVCILVDFGIFLSWKKLDFVTRIFSETTKAVFAMPCLMLLPLWIFLIEIALTILLIYFLVLYSSAGFLTHIFGPYYTYMPTGLMLATLIYTLILFFYLCAFLRGCQQMIVAGAVSTWYFTREKDNILGSPITESFKILFKYHLGSVALGSFIITFMKIVRVLVKGMLRRKEFLLFRFLINCCLDYMEELIHYVSEQAYIMVAMHGQPFISSGKRATKLLIENALSTLAVNTCGDFILFLTKVLVVLLTLICGIILNDGDIVFYWVTLTIGCFLSALIAHSFFRTFEICVDTIFLCYCEDSFIHDGIERPYYAPVEIMAVVDEAKGVIEEEKMYNSIKTEELPQSFV